jgi:hypothetical protein
MTRGDDTDQRQDPAESGYLRFYYRNRRPTRFGRLSNQVWAWASGLGLTPSLLLTLQVKDRHNPWHLSELTRGVAHEMDPLDRGLSRPV